MHAKSGLSWTGPLSGTPVSQSDDPQLVEFRRRVAKNINKDYQLNLRHWAAPGLEAKERSKLQDGAAVDGPSEDEVAPEAPHWHSPLRPRL